MDRKEFFAKAPLNSVRYVTVETYHPGDGLHRYVAGQQFEKSFTLESDAPRDAGALVPFEPVALQSNEVEQGEEGEVSLDVQLGAVGQLIRERMKHVDLWYPIEVVRRVFFDEGSTPDSVVSLEVDNLSSDSDYVMFTASQPNQSALDVSETYTTDRFPGLEEQL